MTKAKIHIGKKIKEVLDKTPMSVVDFAKRINLTRNGAYKVFEKETIDTGQLQTISKVLNHDFFAYYESVELNSVKENKSEYGYATKDELEEVKYAMLKMSKTLERLEKLLLKDLKPKKRIYK
jgi:transcriptional regulator with XRE-family HTH domain